MRKHHIKTLVIILLSSAVLFSCQKNESENVVSKNSQIEINFNLEYDNYNLTKSSITADSSLANGCTVAFYSKATGDTLVTGKCVGATKKIIITRVPSTACDIYAVGNTAFNWPANKSVLSSKTVDVNLMTGSYIPHATSAGEYSWAPGVNTMTLKMKCLYTKINIKKNIGDITFLCSSNDDIKVKNCPSKIYPFSTIICTDTDGETDIASTSDITTFNNGDEISLFVPSNGSSQLQLKAYRNNGNGFDYNDTYTINIPSADAARGKNKDISITTTAGGNITIGTVGTDTREVCWQVNEKTIRCDGNEYPTYVIGEAGNGGQDWNYTVSWTGNSNLSNDTQIKIGTDSWKNLNTSGLSNSITKIDQQIPVLIKSEYTGSAQQTVQLLASIEGGDSETITIIFDAPKEFTGLTLTNAAKVTVGQSTPLTVTANYSDGTSTNVTASSSISYDTDFFTLNESTKVLTSIKKFGCLKIHNLNASYTDPESGVTRNASSTIEVESDKTTSSFAGCTWRITNKSNGNVQTTSSYNGSVQLPLSGEEIDEDIEYKFNFASNQTITTASEYGIKIVNNSNPNVVVGESYVYRTLEPGSTGICNNIMIINCSPNLGAGQTYSGYMKINIFSSSFPYRKHCYMVLPALILSLCTGMILGFRFPYDVFASVRNTFPVITGILKIFSHSTYLVSGILSLAFVYLAHNKKNTQEGAFYLSCFLWFCIIAIGLVELVKFGLGMPRPGHGLIAIPWTLDNNFHSFPSGHTARICIMLLPLALYFHKKRLTWTFTMYTAIIVFSRLWLGKHHPVDVICGVLISLIAAYCIFAFMPSINLLKRKYIKGRNKHE